MATTTMRNAGIPGGATRADDTHKPDFEAFLNPEVLAVYGDYMHLHRNCRDGSLRDGDNWQKGMVPATIMKSLVRHVIDLWRLHRGYQAINPDTDVPFTKRELCCAILFNVSVYLHELIVAEGGVRGRQPDSGQISMDRTVHMPCDCQIYETCSRCMPLRHEPNCHCEGCITVL